MARPRKHFKPENFVELARDYISGGYEAEGDVIPTLEGFSILIDVPREVIYQWADAGDKDVSYTISALNRQQARKLMNGGLAGAMNATMAMRILNVNHGMVERTKQEVTGADGGPVQITEVRRTVVDSQHPDG